MHRRRVLHCVARAAASVLVVGACTGEGRRGSPTTDTPTTDARTTDAPAATNDTLTDGCIDRPPLTLSGDGAPVEMDLVYFGGCGFDEDGDANFDDTFVPATAVRVKGQLELLNAGNGDVLADVRQFAPGTRLAILTPTSPLDPSSIAGNYTVPVEVGGCLVITIGWRSPVQAGQFVALAETEEGACTNSSTQAGGINEIDAEIPFVAIQGEELDEPAPYFGSQNPSGSAAEPAAGFTPAADDEQFCWAVSVINSRPQPRDEFEEVVVADQYFAAIQRFVPPVLAEELSLLIEFTTSIVKAGSFTEADEVPDGDAVATARRAISNFVDRQCLGLS